jgi:glycosyltransferase 2 family protein
MGNHENPPVDRARGVARWLLRVGVSAGIIAYILVDVDNTDLRSALAAVRVQDLVLPLAIFLAGQALSGIKWGMLGRSVGLDRSWLDYIRFYYIGAFFNVFGLSTIGGDVVRGLYLGDGRRPVLALNSVIFDRVTGLALLMATGAAALLAFPQYDFPWLLSAACIAGGLVLVVGWWTCPRLVRILPVGNRIRRQVEDDLGPFWRDTALLLRVSVVSIVFHLSQVTVQYYIARAAGADLPFSYCLIIHPMLSLMMAMPVSIGGFGVREGGYLYFLTRIHIDDSIAVTMGILWFAMTAATGIIGGMVFLLSGAELPRLRARAQAAERMRGVA